MGNKRVLSRSGYEVHNQVIWSNDLSSRLPVEGQMEAGARLSAEDRQGHCCGEAEVLCEVLGS